MIVQQLEETLSTQPLFSALFNIFHSSFFYPVFGIVEAGKRAALTFVEKGLPARGCEGPE